MKNQFHHNSIDEASLNESLDNEIEDDLLNEDNKRRLITSDMDLNNNHLQSAHTSKCQDMPNQKRIARKLINIRQSPRFSPAASSSPTVPITLCSTPQISKSQTSLNSNVLITTSSQSNNNFDQNSNQSINSQLHHHHHHHHHFHHHFHNKNETESQQQQTPATNILDSTQSAFLRLDNTSISDLKT